MVEHTDEVVDVVGPVAAGIQSLGQREERLRVIGEVVNVENSFWVRDAVLLQVSVKACSRSSEKGQFDTDVGDYYGDALISSYSHRDHNSWAFMKPKPNSGVPVKAE